jgi:hypothetical protein
MRLGDWRDMTSLHNVRLKILLSSIANESTADTISLPLAGNSVGLGESDACTLSLLLLRLFTRYLFRARLGLSRTNVKGADTAKKIYVFESNLRAR